MCKIDKKFSGKGSVCFESDAVSIKSDINYLNKIIERLHLNIQETRVTPNWMNKHNRAF